MPIDALEGDGTLAWDSTTMVLVEVRVGDTVGTGWTYGPAACAAVVADLFAPAIDCRDPRDIDGARFAMDKAVRNAGRPGLVGFAISAVDVALWDLKARLLGLPLCGLGEADRARAFDDTAAALRAAPGGGQQALPLGASQVVEAR